MEHIPLESYYGTARGRELGPIEVAPGLCPEETPLKSRPRMTINLVPVRPRCYSVRIVSWWVDTDTPKTNGSREILVCGVSLPGASGTSAENLADVLEELARSLRCS